MIIGIDGNEANTKRRVGIGEYAFQLLKHFEAFHLSDVQFHIYLKEKPLADLPKERKGWQYIVCGPKKLWTQIGLPFYLFTHFPRPAVFFSPTHYAPRFSPVPTVVSVMDVSYLHFPELFAKKDLYQLRSWTKYSVEKATKVFTISQASKNDILEQYGKKSDDIVVTYPGIKEKIDMTDLTKKELQVRYKSCHQNLKTRKK